MSLMPKTSARKSEATSFKVQLPNPPGEVLCSLLVLPVELLLLMSDLIVLHCYEISDIDTINQIKQNPDNIDVILNNLAKDYSKKIED